MDKKYHKNAFTLIELLVVMAIVSLLLSILVPGLQRAKEAGRAVVCKSAIRGLTAEQLKANLMEWYELENRRSVR